MPEKETLERAHEDEREGKSPSTQAGEFVKAEMDHIRQGKHGAASTKQAIAIAPVAPSPCMCVTSRKVVFLTETIHPLALRLRVK